MVTLYLMSEAGRNEILELSWPPPLFLLVHRTHPTFPVSETMLPTFSVGLPVSVKHSWKHLRRHAPRSVSWVFTNNVKLTMKANHCRSTQTCHLKP